MQLTSFIALLILAVHVHAAPAPAAEQEVDTDLMLYSGWKGQWIKREDVEIDNVYWIKGWVKRELDTDDALYEVKRAEAEPEVDVIFYDGPWNTIKE